MNIYKKFLIGLGAVLILGNVVYLYSQYNLTLSVTFSEEKLGKHPLFKQFQKSTIERIQQSVKSLPENSFSESGSQTALIFESFFKSIQSEKLFRIKVWDNNYTVIWSNEPSIIGKRFIDNHEVKESYDGELEAEIILTSDKKENAGEAPFTNYSEIYVPVKNSQGQITGIVETYMGIDDLVQQVRLEFYLKAAQAIGFSVIIFVIMIIFGKFIIGRLIKD